jgi:hypothetical protein
MCAHDSPLRPVKRSVSTFSDWERIALKNVTDELPACTDRCTVTACGV